MTTVFLKSFSVNIEKAYLSSIKNWRLTNTVQKEADETRAKTFGQHLRSLREQRRTVNRRYSVRQTAERIGVEPTHLSKIERGEVFPPSEEAVRRLAADLGEDADLLLAMAGMVANDILAIIVKRPVLFAELIRRLEDATDQELGAFVYEIRNGT
ncbi:MAG: helix-turn-helix domain-containing protein [Phycisphaerales bacterium]|nr:helix-turn-helix domain-containing protein [Phycisphaerales bacterium]